MDMGKYMDTDKDNDRDRDKDTNIERGIETDTGHNIL
jgi:hypothetical protein